MDDTEEIHLPDDNSHEADAGSIEVDQINDAEAGTSLAASIAFVSDKRESEVLVNADDDDKWNEGDICRVCRISGDEASPLFHPCLCTGSIKYVHQNCLTEWLKYSKKSVCELCNHKFTFRPVYREDMPEQLPLIELAHGLSSITYRYIRLFLVYCLAFFCWLALVPLVACRVHRLVFEGSVLNSLNFLYSLNASSIAAIFSPHDIALDILRGTTIVAIFLCSFILLVFLREQIINAGPPELFNLDPPAEPVVDVAPVEPVVPLNPPPREGPEQALFDLLNHFDDPRRNAAVQPAVLQQPDAQVNVPVLAQGDGAAAQGEEGENWGQNVERIVEDLTWQRLLGLDGSLIFIEHVIWMISLNTVFIILCLYFPCKIGEYTLLLLGMQVKGMYFSALLNFFVGYISILGSVIICHQMMKFLRIKEAYWMMGFFFLMMKVSLLIVLEVFIFPSFCGWWLDICSLALTGSGLKGRLKTLTAYPLSSIFVHWLVGMIDVFYSASFILLLRELLRPGVLWFVRDLNDPEFQPIQEMIEQGFVRHFRRLVASTTLFFSIIFIMVYLPLKLVTLLLPAVLPYSFNLASEMPLGEFSFELILLQVILPTILEQSAAQFLLKAFVIQWCKVVGNWLGLAEYLLPANVLLGLPADAMVVPNFAQPANELIQENNEIGDAEQDEETDTDTIESDDEDQEVEPNIDVAPPVPAVQLFPNNNNNADTFVKPSYFGIRILTLLFLLSVTGVLISFFTFVVPVTMGRYLVQWLLNSKNPNDLYTVSLGLYIVWLSIKAGMIAKMWIQQGWGVFCSAAVFLGRVLVAAIPLVVIIPYLIGIYFQLLVVGPLRVASHQTPLYFPFKDWAMGLVHFKLFCASVFVGPEWWLKTIFERLYEDGVRNYHISTLYMQVVIPLIMFITFLICFPYVLGSVISFTLGLGYESQLTVIRYMYPGTISVFLICLFVAWQWKKMKKLANKIRNEKYLIGTQLVNFYRENQLKFKQN